LLSILEISLECLGRLHDANLGLFEAVFFVPEDVVNGGIFAAACILQVDGCFRRSYWWITLMFDSKLESLLS
jgi:hypothetical protein